MRIKQNDDTRLVIVDFPWLMGGCCLLGTLMGAYALAYQIWHGITREELIGFSVGTLLFLGTTLFLVRRTIFDFDRRARVLNWRIQGFPRAPAGSVTFDEILGAEIQYMSGEHGPACRLAIKTTGKCIPLSNAYSEGKAEEACCIELQRAIQKILGQGAAKTDDEILALAASGKKIEAIQLVQAHYHLNLTQAKQFVEDLNAPAANLTSNDAPAP